jgi:dephospho-CoA kinase
VPLLLESNWDVCCDEIWSIDSPLVNRLERSKQRGWDANELSRRESKQLAISEKNRLSTHTIMNDSTLIDLHATIVEHWDRLLRRKNDPTAPPSLRHCLTDLSVPPRG